MNVLQQGENKTKEVIERFYRRCCSITISL